MAEGREHALGAFAEVFVSKNVYYFISRRRTDYFEKPKEVQTIATFFLCVIPSVLDASSLPNIHFLSFRNQVHENDHKHQTCQKTCALL